MKNSVKTSTEVSVQGTATEIVKAPAKRTPATKIDFVAIAASLSQSVSTSIATEVAVQIVPVVADLKTDINAINARLDNLTNVLNSKVVGISMKGQPTPKVQSQIKAPAQVTIYGTCSKCQVGLTSKNVVDFSVKKFGVCLCMKCQPKAPVTQKAPVATPVQIKKACMVCKTEITYADVTAMNASVAKATGLGLKPVICSKCAKATLAQRPATQDVVPPTTPAKITKRCMVCDKIELTYKTVEDMNVFIGQSTALGLKPITCSRCKSAILAQRDADAKANEFVPEVNSANEDPQF